MLARSYSLLEIVEELMLFSCSATRAPTSFTSLYMISINHYTSTITHTN